MCANTRSELGESLAKELRKPLTFWRLLFSYGMTAIAFVFTALALIPLLSILAEIIGRGLSKLKPEVLVSLPAPPGLEGVTNGFANAIVGTIITVGIAAILSIPCGVMTGIYLAEFGKESRLANIVRFITQILTGVPSIVVGVFAYGVIVLTTKKFSALAGGFALSIIMLPIITLTVEEALKLIPMSLRLASAALGGTRLQTTFHVVVTAALPGITTGILLAIARAAGETAPLIFTALFSQTWSEGLFSPSASLSVLIYNNANSPYPEQNELAWTASIVLLGLVLFINIASRLLTRKR
ncbi:MAG: phosphate ABC transporter permease PstA [Nostocaceae cyanobacterium]|nr:phosphate ABC transporter permease PstA [Nostocaceae cyanobacterium]